GWGTRAGHAGVMVAAVVTATLMGSAGARAENFFDFLFGTLRKMATPTPPDTNDKLAVPGPERPEGPPQAFCVRLCDGYNFPIAHHVNATPVELCEAMCPGTRTNIFQGSVIDDAYSEEGTRYGDLPNAFVFRQRLVPDCTCNGKDGFGLASMDAESDPTLQPGDVVATASGLMAYTPGHARRGDAAVNFTPIDHYSGLSGELRHHLATISVAPNK
ncbi:MAG TPA: DUF2865 domain-containing protein, partial [Xanthobacteraceae bacterium]|nr:DUF2865 domain-containing protein [Xanthobacteraceae bacterium]